MQRQSQTLARALHGALLLAALAVATPTLAQAPAPVPAPAQPADAAQLQKQLDDARVRLDDAARDVADLTRQLYGDDAAGMPPGFGRGGRGAMLGINIGGGRDRADGVEVMGVSPSGPAATAGIRTGDVIVAIDGKAVRKAEGRPAGRELVDYLRSVQPGQKVKVDYLRDGKKQTATVTTVAAKPPMFRMLREHMPMVDGMPMPPDFDGMMMMPPGGRGFRALELVPVTPKLGQYFGTDKGLLVVKAPPPVDGKAGGLEEGDVILAIGGRTPENPGHAFRILGSYEPGEKVKVDVLRQRKRITVDVPVPSANARGPGMHPMPPGPPQSPRAPTPPAPPMDAKGGISS